MEKRIEIEEALAGLFHRCFGSEPESMILLPASGSARKYYRLSAGNFVCVGTWHADVAENRLFVDFSRHFRKCGLHVPEIYVMSEDGFAYLQEDLGDRMLLDVIVMEREQGDLTPHLMELYRKVLSELLRFQFLGHVGLDYSHCIPRPVFDRRCILWDLNYFKYCFLRLAGGVFSEEALENDFSRLTDRLCRVDNQAFMFRDFQSRNIMVRDEEVWFIDYQGGRQGALQYDVASLLYDAIVHMPDVQRECLLDDYIGELQTYRSVDSLQFREEYYHFVLIRLLQAMGAFGLRGLYEKKAHFIDSIQPGLENICRLFQAGKVGADYAEIWHVCEQLRRSERFLRL